GWWHTTKSGFTKGVRDWLVLEPLARRPMYGYELVRAVEQATGQVLQFGEGCIYPVLHRLEKDAFLTSRREIVSGRSRVVYRTTAAGRKRLAGSIGTWKGIVAAVNQVLVGGEHGRAARA